ncbi:DUF7793 family protein [Arthrobacter mangrovi]|uniref:DUF7793 domain-containing protein n=1 Tax=Arthrobacter mangrovi TaxID=2966350 RepID=A0ABQ5N000_9MICC|nr:STAS/SEC14 domain-containing protein [Arthrobacter mangrovi]GLB69566.1 hypothetical protein AHIS1636_40120 [Arthrobacter mangrovi]
MTERFTDARTASLRMTREGLLHLRWNIGVDIGEVDARAAMELVNEMCTDRPCPLLIDMTGTGSISRGARTVFTRRSCASKIALIGSSPVDRVLVNFFLHVNTPPCPTRFFTSRTQAARWLLEH